MYILVGMLFIGLICNLLIKPVADKWFMSDAELAEEKRLAHEKSLANVSNTSISNDQTTSLQIILAWGFVGLPLAWGVYRTGLSALKLFS